MGVLPSKKTETTAGEQGQAFLITGGKKNGVTKGEGKQSSKNWKGSQVGGVRNTRGIRRSVLNTLRGGGREREGKKGICRPLGEQTMVKNDKRPRDLNGPGKLNHWGGKKKEKKKPSAPKGSDPFSRGKVRGVLGGSGLGGRLVAELVGRKKNGGL